MELASASVIVGLFIDWVWTASRSLQILGTDAAHYHVPHALNFYLGVNPFIFLATSHLYPMGTSVWAAWFFQPSSDPLLLELATAPAFLLLLASACLLFRILTGRSGLAWMPWALLPAFTGTLPRLTLLMSADLAYAATFVALVALTFSTWQCGRLEARHLVGGGLCAGLLVSTKSTGLVSAALISLFAAGIVFTRRRNGSQTAPRRSWILGALALFFAAGGIWIVRNWWLFGSPIAPFGLSLAGFRIFPGQSPSAMKYYLSVLGDLRRQPGYPLASRFTRAVRDMFGVWVFPAGALSLLLAADIAQQWIRRRELDRATTAKLIFTGFFFTTFAAHALLLARLPWTSLEWTHRLSLRYLLPFFPLYVIGLYSFAFMGAFTWRRAGALRAVLAAILVPGAIWYYGTHQSTPGLSSDETVAALRVVPVAVSAVLVAALFAWAAGWHRAVSRAAAVALAAAIVVAVSWHGAADHERVVREREQAYDREEQGLRVGLQPAFPHRGLYWRIRQFQRTAAVSCGRTRFFLASRFDLPLDLQDERYRNIVIDIGVSSAAAAAQLEMGRRGCDFVVGLRAEMAEDARRLADLFGGRAPEQVATYGPYGAYTKP